MDRLESMVSIVADSKRAALLAACANGADNDLAPEDRPDRADRSDLGALKDGDDVIASGTPVRVICPGRGRGWFYSMIIEEQGFTIGQHEAQYVTDRAPADPNETPMPIFPEPETSPP